MWSIFRHSLQSAAILLRWDLSSFAQGTFICMFRHIWRLLNVFGSVIPYASVCDVARLKEGEPKQQRMKKTSKNKMRNIKVNKFE
jgi:hypothetical protein